MKKITFLFLGSLFFLGVVSNAQVTLSQSVDPSTIDTGGVACWSSPAQGGTGEYRDNAFARTYDLANDFSIAGDFEISAVEFGQGSADDGKVVQVNIYTVDTEDLSTATFTLIETVDVPLFSADDLSLITANISATIPAGSIVAVEVFAPDEGAVIAQTFFPGFNLAGQNNTAWIKSDGTGTGGASTGCDIPWQDASALGAGPQEYVINLVGEEVLSVNDNLSSQVSVYPNPATDVINIKTPSNIQVTGATLYDLLGKNTGIVFANGQVDVSGLSRGVYMLTVDTNEGSLTQKIVKR
mgnify:CR=1 FL=1|tara:strand:- start:48579 stop:49469 length:891 start_codon:yes stop_codon:yes gene_type:complete